VSPPNWKTKSGPLVETPVLHGSPPGQAMLACDLGTDGFESKGLAVFAPETANAMTPYHVSPVDGVCTDMVSAVTGAGATAYHV
jgi:hypothetical protein